MKLLKQSKQQIVAQARQIVMAAEKESSFVCIFEGTANQDLPMG